MGLLFLVKQKNAAVCLLKRYLELVEHIQSSVQWHLLQTNKNVPLTGEMLSGVFNHGVMIFAQTNDKLNIRIHLAGGNDQDGSFMLDGYVFMTASLSLTISEELAICLLAPLISRFQASTKCSDNELEKNNWIIECLSPPTFANLLLTLCWNKISSIYDVLYSKTLFV